jgi:rubredoxin
LKNAILRYRTVASEETSVEAKTFWLTDIQRESEEDSIDCPDCYDDMIRFYDWDSIRYRCENCDLILKSNENDADNDF